MPIEYLDTNVVELGRLGRQNINALGWRVTVITEEGEAT